MDLNGKEGEEELEGIEGGQAIIRMLCPDPKVLQTTRSPTGMQKWESLFKLKLGLAAVSDAAEWEGEALSPVSGKYL